MPCKRFLVLALSLVVMGMPEPSGRPLRAADWPGWRGSDRTGVSAETGLLTQWPEKGPTLLWKATGLGGGYSTPSVAGGRIYLMGSKAGEEFLLTLDAKDGKRLWETKIGAVGKPNQRPSYPGTRSTPTVDGEHIYALGSDGDLACVDKAGKVVWHKHLVKDFGGGSGTWAYAESPLIDDDALVCTPGGAQAALAALNKKTGDVIWKAQVSGGGEAAYASAIVADAAGQKQYVQFLRNGVVGVSAKAGKFLWRYDKIGGSTNCSTPIFHDGCVFSSVGGTGTTGCALLRLNADGGGVSAQQVYLIKTLSNHHGGVVRVGNALYGTNNAGLVCLDFKSGDVKWQERGVGKGAVSAADGHLYVRGERSGDVALVEATPAGYKEKGRFSQPDRSERNAWPHPVIADGRLYLRDDDVLLCYDIKAK